MLEFKQLSVDRSKPGRWTVTFRNAPINVLGPAGITELHAVVSEAEEDTSVRTVIFQSGDPDFFIAHFETPESSPAQGISGPVVYEPWIDLVLLLSKASFISIAKIRGRTRGVGNEFILACDMRFASRQGALFSNPEVGVGLPPGGGALEWLPRIVGRSRALEIVLSGDDFDADVAARYGWVNRTLEDEELDPYVESLAMRFATYDREAIATIKAQINRVGVPSAAELESSNGLFFAALAWPGARKRRDKLRAMGYGVRSDFELNFGRFLTLLGP